MKKILGIVLLLLVMMLPLWPSWDQNTAITARSRMLSLIGETGSVQVIRGKGDFLFLAESVEGLLNPLPEERLNALAQALAELSGQLRSNNRQLLVLIAPDKRSVYPEMLPECLHPGFDSWQRIYDALSAAAVSTLNVLPALKAEKQTGPVYFAGDTHWNARGALVVYRLLAKQLEINNAQLYQGIGFEPGAAGDLIRLCRPADPDEEPDAFPVLERHYRAAKPFANLDAMKIETTCETNDLTLLVVRDSFGKALFSYLAENAGHLIYSRNYSDIAGQAASAGADAVVLEIVERDAEQLLRNLEK